ncbi:MAG: class I SAM-dependent methyltransferase [Polyangiaceae bacterium]|nr:class I SAM-dependent methyltransferase [Polyangiaceae bacterium]
MSEAERWLKDWHAKRPGVTARSVARGKPSSYDRLAGLVRRGDRVLDLACGDGLLLEKVLTQGAAEATGLDMSAAELGAALARLGDGARLVEGRAQALPFGDGSFDLVTCHLAFMLMDAVDEVVTEVRRVLRPGGQFGVVVGGPPAEDDAWTRVAQLFVGTGPVGPVLGDRRCHHEAGLRELLQAFGEVRVEGFSVDLSGSEEQVWELMLDTYLFEMVAEDKRAEFERAARAAVRELAREDGTIPCTFPMSMAVGRR